MPREAVVIGASVAGLLAARVLARHFDAVTIVEKDACDPAIAARKGVPQGNHIHLLWSGGMQVIEGLFPGIAEDLVAAGGTTLRQRQRHALVPPWRVEAAPRAAA